MYVRFDEFSSSYSSLDQIPRTFPIVSLSRYRTAISIFLVQSSVLFQPRPFSSSQSGRPTPFHDGPNIRKYGTTSNSDLTLCTSVSTSLRDLATSLELIMHQIHYCDNVYC